MQDFLHQALADARSYPEYRAHLTELLAAGQTTGPNQSEAYVGFAQLNQARMDRLDRKARFVPEVSAVLAGLQKNYLLLAITEGWCGDAAQILPIVHHLTQATDKLDLRLVLRDEHPGLMDQYLTDGARAIPKILFLDAATHQVVADWGPRPAAAQQMAMDYKHHPQPKPDYQAFNRELHGWYAKDKTTSTQEELLDVLRKLETKG